MSYRSICLIVALAFAWCGAIFTPLAVAQEDPAISIIRGSSEKLAAAFNAGKAEEMAAMFLPKGELIDEEGTVYQGQAEVKDLLTAFFEKFPGTKMQNEIESIRLVGPVAIEEGTRVTTAKDGTTARIRYISIRAKTDQGWQIASVRDFADETMPAPGELLQPLEWLIGDWINEGADARVKISYRWSEDKNFILGDFIVTRNDQTVMKSSQRIGWDPLLGKPRSWTFDSDGGYGDSTWTPVDGAWVIRSSAVNPDGQTGSANITITPGENGRYVMAGTHRIIGDVLEDDFEISVVKQPPAVGK